MTRNPPFLYGGYGMSCVMSNRLGRCPGSRSGRRAACGFSNGGVLIREIDAVRIFAERTQSSSQPSRFSSGGELDGTEVRDAEAS